ncbi:MAG: hypothetical protein A2941_01935 [Candidatus Yanofskybacteria bacterium RIFCSPLOWO2_01_FULL_49_17]|uniref:Uncharacterized protein n=1 Tax=Candidatus Yanofskybacteria bacterium RIFCSPLOWO2_01_FULL_49_17 TaxID=1802700 RepID=A0A1F8GUF6_9BACT|nr:MAG: hypothetical protein A2941_01935 [Candidatus Yanofskybacteria bacterium RIFCSPLOWO2_01_FULL_49_17]
MIAGIATIRIAQDVWSGPVIILSVQAVLKQLVPIKTSTTAELLAHQPKAATAAGIATIRIAPGPIRLRATEGIIAARIQATPPATNLLLDRRNIPSPPI